MNQQDCYEQATELTNVVNIKKQSNILFLKRTNVSYCFFVIKKYWCGKHYNQLFATVLILKYEINAGVFR